MDWGFPPPRPLYVSRRQGPGGVPRTFLRTGHPSGLIPVSLTVSRCCFVPLGGSRGEEVVSFSAKVDEGLGVYLDTEEKGWVRIFLSVSRTVRVAVGVPTPRPTVNPTCDQVSTNFQEENKIEGEVIPLEVWGPDGSDPSTSSSLVFTRGEIRYLVDISL